MGRIYTSIDPYEIRKDFPIFERRVHGKPLIYLDNAATTQKHLSVIQSLSDYYHNYNANIHRGIHTLAEEATRAYEATREKVRAFINAPTAQEVIFVRGVTEGINLVASSYGRLVLKHNDEVIISALEHHSNIVPWQLVCEQTGAILKVIRVTDRGEIDLEHYNSLLSDRTRIVAVNHASNSLGTINPVKEIIRLAHRHQAAVLIDGAQAGAHLPIDVQDMNCDFYCLSSHKMYGPTGTGILYGKKHLLEQMPPYQGGGEMIREVTFEKTTWNDLPYKFEAGTPNIADVIAFGKAIAFMEQTGREEMAAHEQALLRYATEKISSLPGVRIIGTAPEKVSVLSFVVEGIHPFDVGQLLDARGIAVRTGHHCTQPLMDRFDIEGTVRASFAVYNTFEEIDALAEGVKRIINFARQ